MKKPLIVQKFGGTSVGSIESIHIVAEHIIKARQQGHQVVVVVSAMAGETNRLLGLAQEVDAIPQARELDVLLSAGEQVSMALLAIALNKLGHCACSLTGGQARIRTNNHFNDATIEHIDTQAIITELEKDNIVIVAGFQGVDELNNITTLGRGGSDTTAVALAAALNAQECQIFTDVDGIYTCDPRVVKSAIKLPSVNFSVMEDMARMGAKVLHLPSVEYAHRHNVPLRVLSTFERGEGSLVNKKGTSNDLAGIAIQKNMMLIQFDSEVCATLTKQCHLLGIDVWNVTKEAKTSTIVIKQESFAKLQHFFGDNVCNNVIVSLLTLVGIKAANALEQAKLRLQQKGITPTFQFVQSRSSVLVLCPSLVEQAANELHDAYFTSCNLVLFDE